VGAGYQHFEIDARLAHYWWEEAYPKANVGLLLEPSKLVVVDLDSEEALREAKGKGLPDTARVFTGKGWHFFYKRTDDYPLGRATQRGESKGIDVLSRGYVVAPASTHATGRVYYWEVFPMGEDLPEPPWWTRKLFPKRLPPWMLKGDYRSHSSQSKFQPNEADPEAIRAALTRLEPDDYEEWLHIGFALQTWDENGDGKGRGFDLWDEWSRTSDKYPGVGDLQKKWRSFRRQRGGLGLGTLFNKAKQKGWDPQDQFNSGGQCTGTSWKST
jgi:hypothetical protein